MSSELFPATQWTLVREAAAGDPERARAALRRLCGHYAHAITGYMRWAGLVGDEAEEAAQEFLHGWLSREENPLRFFERRELRFRAYLCACLRYFLREWRPSALDAVPLDAGTEDLPAPPVHPEHVLDRGLAHEIAHAAVLRVRRAWLEGPRAAAFPSVARIVFLEDETPYADLARRHDCGENTVKGWVLSLRRDYYESFRAETARISLPDELAEETRYLMTLAPIARDGHSFFAGLRDLFE